MKELWCWRCKMVVPMLEEDEWEEVHELLSAGTRSTKEFRQAHNLPLEGISVDEHFQPALDAYERITGFKETNPRALWHHRVSLYGPPCTNCGKPLRTPKAKMCAACGEKRAA